MYAALSLVRNPEVYRPQGLSNNDAYTPQTIGARAAAVANIPGGDMPQQQPATELQGFGRESSGAPLRPQSSNVSTAIRQIVSSRSSQLQGFPQHEVPSASGFSWYSQSPGFPQHEVPLASGVSRASQSQGFPQHEVPLASGAAGCRRRKGFPSMRFHLHHEVLAGHRRQKGFLSFHLHQAAVYQISRQCHHYRRFRSHIV